MRTILSLLLLGAAAVAPACKSTADSKGAPAPSSQPPVAPPATTAAPAPAPAPAPAASTLTDAQIAAIVVAANQVDIDAGKLAVERTTSAEVKKLAQQMVTDHTAVNQAAVALVTRLKVTPEETDASRGLLASGAETRQRLASLEGAAFDRAYVDNEVAYHQAVIGVLDSQLVPSATNGELKQALIGVRPAFVAHLQHAQQLQAALAGTPAPAHASAAHGAGH